MNNNNYIRCKKLKGKMYSPPGDKGNCGFQAVAAACFGDGNYDKGQKMWASVKSMMYFTFITNELAYKKIYPYDSYDCCKRSLETQFDPEDTDLWFSNNIHCQVAADTFSCPVGICFMQDGELLSELFYPMNGHKTEEPIYLYLENNKRNPASNHWYTLIPEQQLDYRLSPCSYKLLKLKQSKKFIEYIIYKYNLIKP